MHSARFAPQERSPVERVTGAPRSVAEAALDRADLEVKTAIVIVVRSSTVEEARQRLVASGGRLRAALEAPA